MLPLTFVKYFRNHHNNLLEHSVWVVTTLQVLCGAINFHKKSHRNHQSDLMPFRHSFFSTSPNREMSDRNVRKKFKKSTIGSTASLTASLLSNLNRLMITLCMAFTLDKGKFCNLENERNLKRSMVAIF